VLWERQRPSPSIVGIALTTLSIVAMYWLARAKRRASAGLASRALEADAFQTTACFWLSLVTLAGISLSAVLGWWWADPVAALGDDVVHREGGRRGLARRGVRVFWCRPVRGEAPEGAVRV
jgi:divalent metal cation (Fe/Co/Zn/Cd) transporter